MSQKEKHKFALYFKDLKETDFIHLVEKNLVNRISKILKLTPGDNVEIFNQQFVADCKIVSIDKKEVGLEVFQFKSTEKPKIKVNLFVGLLKKDSWESVLYSASEIGASKIQPIITQKIHKNWWQNKFKDRFELILISAAEQSKNFSFPHVLDPVSFEDFLHGIKDYKNKILFEPDGDNVIEVYNSLDKNEDINLVVGPEGDFSCLEKEKLDNFNLKKCRLTSNILRSVQAVNVGLGCFQSFIN